MDLIVDVKISQNLLDRPVRNVAVGLFAADWKKTDLTSRCGYWATPDRDPVSSAKQPTKKSGDNNDQNTRDASRHQFASKSQARPPQGRQRHLRLALRQGGSAAFEAARVFCVALPFVLRVFRIRAERAALARKCLTGRGHRLRRDTLLHPVRKRAQQIELIEREASSAMAHPRNKIELAPFGDGVEPPIRCGHVLEVITLDRYRTHASACS